MRVQEPRAVQLGRSSSMLASAALCAALGCTPLTGTRSGTLDAPNNASAFDDERSPKPGPGPDAGTDASFGIDAGPSDAGTAQDAGAERTPASAGAGGQTQARGASGGSTADRAVSNAGAGGAAGAAAPEAPVEVECLPISVDEVVGRRLQVQCEKPLDVNGDRVAVLAIDATSSARASERFLELAIGAFVKRTVLRATLVTTAQGSSEGCPPESCRTLRSLSIRP